MIQNILKDLYLYCVPSYLVYDKYSHHYVGKETILAATDPNKGILYRNSNRKVLNDSLLITSGNKSYIWKIKANIESWKQINGRNLRKLSEAKNLKNGYFYLVDDYEKHDIVLTVAKYINGYFYRLRCNEKTGKISHFTMMKDSGIYYLDIPFHVVEEIDKL